MAYYFPQFHEFEENDKLWKRLYRVDYDEQI